MDVSEAVESFKLEANELISEKEETSSDCSLTSDEDLTLTSLLDFAEFRYDVSCPV